VGQVGIVLFNIQILGAVVLLNQIDTKIQDATPSQVRSSILSIVSTIGRVVTVPASIGMGWVFTHYNELVAVRSIGVLCALVLLIFVVNRKVIKV
jgi:hypothetical protein